MLASLKKKIDWIIGYILIAMMSFMVVCVSWQVFSRYILKIPSTMTDELARFLLIWVALLGSAYAVGLQKHLNIDLLIAHFPSRTQKFISLFINLVIAVFSTSVIIVGGIGLVRTVLASGQLAAALIFPFGYIYLILPFSGFIIVFYSLYFLIEGIADLRINNATSSDPSKGA
jgi:TRAP-type C4-dicarboxylate transport system permease small subunit